MPKYKKKITKFMELKCKLGIHNFKPHGQGLHQWYQCENEYCGRTKKGEKIHYASVQEEDN